MTDTIKLDEAMNNVWRYLLNEKDEKTILAALKFAKAMMPKPIEEAPRDGTRIYTDEGVVRYEEYRYGNYWLCCYPDDGEFSCADHGHFKANPTHFTPLPDQALKELEEQLK